jgi:hypothetical protein
MIAYNPNDIDAARRLMDDADKYPDPLSGTNQDGEECELHIGRDSIIYKVFREDGHSFSVVTDRDGSIGHLCDNDELPRNAYVRGTRPATKSRRGRPTKRAR